MRLQERISCSRNSNSSDMAIDSTAIQVNQLQEFQDLLTAASRTIRNWARASIGRDDEISIWLHDGGAFGQSYLKYALYLSTLALLYDRIYWYRPCSALLIPEAFRRDEEFNRTLKPLGVLDSFPTLVAELVSARVIVPVGSRLDHSLPIESEQEATVLRHLVEVPTLDHVGIDGFAEFAHIISGVSRIKSVGIDDELPRVVSDIIEALVFHKAFSSSTVFAANEYAMFVWRSVFGITGENPDTLKAGLDMIDISNLFLERIVLRAPQVMDPDQVLKLRETRASKEMRSWLCSTYAAAAKQMFRSDPMDAVIAEFNALAESHGMRRGVTILDFALSALVGSLGALAGGIPGALVGAGGTLFIKPALRSMLAKPLAQYRWVVSLCNLREQHRPKAEADEVD